MPESQEYETKQGEGYKMEIRGGKFVSLKADNLRLGLKMSVVPFTNAMGVQSDKDFEVLFYKGDKQVSDTPELISTGELLGMDNQVAPPIDPDFVEETFGQKYVKSFQAIKSFSDFDDLVNKTFPDVIERRHQNA